jgi:hypothetical protein
MPPQSAAADFTDENNDKWNKKYNTVALYLSIPFNI